MFVAPDCRFEVRPGRSPPMSLEPRKKELLSRRLERVLTIATHPTPQAQAR